MYTLFSHRGNEKRFIENTKDAILNCEYEGIEVDVRLTYDNNIILHHDDTYKRIYNLSYKVRDLDLQQMEHYDSLVEISQFLNFCKINKKKTIIDIKEETYEDIVLIIDVCVAYSKKIKYNINNIVFLCWKDILKPHKNITYLRAIDEDRISKSKIDVYKNELLFDGICLKYTGKYQNIKSINRIKSNDMLVNIYTDKNIQDINLTFIKPDFITL
jgi:glycerophosphoryl diester phosphodiesterase